MKRRTWIVLALLSALGIAGALLVWLSSGVDVQPAPETVAGSPRRKVFELGTADVNTTVKEKLAQALAVCIRCADGSETGEACNACSAPSAPVEPVPVVEEVPSETAELVVDVLNEDGRLEERAQVHVRDCSVKGRDGNVFQVVWGESCLVQASRKEGALWIPAPSEKVFVPSEGAYVQLELPRARVGGLGIQFNRRPDGIHVARVMPGSPADRLGLEHGDRILDVNGTSTPGMDQDAFIRTMTGPEGSEVEFSVLHADGTTERLVLTREVIPES